jgi:ankyrin repeat protein
MVEAAAQGVESMLWLATFRGNVGQVRTLLENGAEVDEEGVYRGPDRKWAFQGKLVKTTPLQKACMDGNWEIVDLLLQHGASVSFLGEAEKSPLFLAAQQGCQKSVELLLEKKADVYFEDKCGDTPLKIALICELASASLVRVLLDHGSNVFKDHNREMETVIYDCGDDPEIQDVIKQEINTRHKCAAFAMALHERLGVGSKPQVFDLEIMHMIISAVQ